MRILITGPDLNSHGGVANYYSNILPHLKKYQNLYIDYLDIGDKLRNPWIIGPIYDQWRFFQKISASRPNLIHVNPSLDPKSFIRDGFFVFWAINKNIPVLVFFHGWTDNFAKLVHKKFRLYFRATFSKATAFLVLDSAISHILSRWAPNVPIYKETTTVDGSLLDGFNLNDKINRQIQRSEFKILFMSRILLSKGILTAIDTCQLLQKAGVPFKLLVAGDGPDREMTERIGKERLDNRVEFLGYVRGKKKREILEKSDVFLFPPVLREGMPVALLEAMAFGLPLVIRTIGGIHDFFVEGKMGFGTKSTDPAFFAEALMKLWIDRTLEINIAKYNHEYAFEHFITSKVAKRLHAIYKEISKPNTF